MKYCRMNVLFHKMRWWCFVGAALFISAWVMDYSGALHEREEVERWRRENIIGCGNMDTETWHPALFIGFALTVISTIGFAATGYRNRRKELVG